jgi:uncharacterized protein (DUF983 family)
MRYWTILGRSLRLRCPVCGRAKLFKDLLWMHEKCPSCGAAFEREPGFFLGSIYVNYGLTALVVAIAYPLLMFNRVLSHNTLMWITLAFVLLFPLWFFRYARALWLGFDQYWDPRPGETGTGKE